MKVVKVGSTKLKGFPVKDVKPVNTEAKIRKAEQMRKNPTRSEERLRGMLASKGYKFQFQHLLYGYIADFYFPGRKWIVELDGGWHNRDKDAERDRRLLEKGFKTLRIPSSAMFTEPKIVMREIEQTVKPVRCRKKKQADWQQVPKLTKDHLPA